MASFWVKGTLIALKGGLYIELIILSYGIKNFKLDQMSDWSKLQKHASPGWKPFVQANTSLSFFNYH